MDVVSEYLDTKVSYDEYIESLINGGPNVCDFYGGYGDKYDAAMKNMAWNPKELFAKEFADVCPNRDAKILEIGCGTGLFGEQLTKLGYENIDGLEGSRDFFELALKKGIKYKNFVQLIIKEDTLLPFKSETYDVVLACDVVYKEHLSIKSFENIIRVIKPGGLLGWSNEICFKHPWSYYNPEPEEYEYLNSLVKRRLVEPLDDYQPKVVKSMPNECEQQVWFLRVL